MANSPDRIIGPNPAEAALVNTLTGPIRKSRIIAGAAAGLGIPVSVILAACVPPAEVRSISTPIAEATTTSQVCNPDEFMKKQGYPTPIAVGGEARLGEVGEAEAKAEAALFTRIKAIGEKAILCEFLTPDDLATLDVFNKKYAAKTSEPVPVTKPPITPTSAPPDEPTAEVKEAIDCGILSSPEACANGKYVQWGVWSPSGTVQIQGMAFTLKPGEEVRIPENFVVAASKYNEPGAYNGHAIKGITRDGKRSIKFIGDVEPTNGVAQVGKDFPAGTVVGIAGNTGEAVLPGLNYNLLVILPTEEDLKNTFPDQTKKPPIIIKNETLESAPKQPQGGGGGAVFFDVTPPKTSK